MEIFSKITLLSRIFPYRILLFFLFANNIFATDKSGSLKGKIVDTESNSVISYAKIIVLNEESGKSVQTLSDNSGKYIFEKLNEGKYKITVSSIGYKDFENEILVFNDSTTVFNIFLELSPVETDRINVTSTKTEVTLQQTPSSISIVTSEEIARKNVLTFDNVLEEVQGVTINRSNGINVSSLSIRGSSDVAGGGIGNRVLLLLDGRPALTGDSKGALWSLIPISLIERTEVVKGAFSSLYGSSAIGGVVNVITKKPTYKSFTSVNLNYGFYERLPDNLKFSDNTQAFTGGDIIQSNTINKFSYLLDFNYLTNNGHAQQTDYGFYGLTGKFTFDLFSNRDLEASAQFTKSNSGFPHYWRKDVGEPADPYKIANVYIGDNIEKETQSYDLFYRAVPGANSKYTTRFYYYTILSNSYYNPNNPVSLQYADSGMGLNTYIDSYNLGNISQMDMQLGKSNYLITGFDFQINKVNSDPEDVLYGNQQMNNIGIFAQDQINLIKDKMGNEVLTSTIGARLDYNKVVNGTESFQISPKISFIYTPAISLGLINNTSYRILAGRAFRAPSIAEIYFKKELFGGFEFIYNPDLQPEEMVSFEIGLKKQYKTRFTIDAAFFINYYTNLIQYVNIGNAVNGPFQVQNVANAQINGFEFYIDYNSALNLFNKPFGYSFNVGYTYLNARDLSENRKDDYLPYKASHNFNYTANFNYADFNLNINGRYLSAIEEVIFFKFEEPEAYFLFNVKLSTELMNNLSVFIAANNLFDESYQELERIQAPNRNFNTGVSLNF